MAGAAFGLPDHDARPRPADHRGNVCGFEFRGTRCEKRGAHYCEPRADKVVAFFAEYLTHQAGGPYSLKPFVLEPFQEHDIIRPLFGEVVWTEWGCYGRRFRLASIVLARKNGKTGLLAGILLYLLVGDGEHAAQVYTAAIDTDQAKLVYQPAANMAKASEALSGILHENKQTKRLIDDERSSYFAVIPADADGALGFNPHGVGIDEVLNQPNSLLFDALRTGMGARVQPMLILATTETNKPVSFGAAAIDLAERIQEKPEIAWHHFAYVRKLPRDERELERLRRIFPGHPDLPVLTEVVENGKKRKVVDITDERNWKWPNPALDGFLKRQAMREEVADALSSATAMASFRQFRMNQRAQSASRFIDLGLWDLNIGEHGEIATPTEVRELVLGGRAWAGLDLSSKLDLTAWLMLFENGEMLPRFWVPESRVPDLHEATGGKFSEWVAAGWVTATEGDTIDYDTVYADIEKDATDFIIERVVYDKWSGEPVRQELEKRTGLEMVESSTTFERMTNPMNELERGLLAHRFQHLGHPVMRWMADNVEAKRPTDDPDRIRPVKPAKNATAKHVDGILALLFAIDAQLSTIGQTTESAYEENDLRVV